MLINIVFYTRVCACCGDGDVLCGGDRVCGGYRGDDRGEPCVYDRGDD